MTLPGVVLWVAGIALGVAIFVLVLPWLVRPFLRCVLWPRYGFRIASRSHMPRTGPALVASNHVTWIDGFLLLAVLPARTHVLVNATYISLPVVRWLARRAGSIPVPSQGPHAQRHAISAVRKAFDRGEIVLIFPEAQLTRNGLLGPFYRGLEAMLKGHDAVPVIPVFLDGLWGSLFSHSDDCFFCKRPQGWRRTVCVAFGPPVPAPRTACAVRQAVQEAGVHAFELRSGQKRALETLDLGLPHWRHPELGLLTASTADFDRGGIHQTGQKPGTVGQTVPGVALRVVDGHGAILSPDTEGRIEVLRAGQDTWVDSKRRGSLDREGFLRLA